MAQNPQSRNECMKCHKFYLSIWISGAQGFCDKCMKLDHEELLSQTQHEHERQMALEQLQHDKDEAERRRRHETEGAIRRQKHDREESERKRQHDMNEYTKKLELEKVKKAQEEIKLKQIQEQCKRDRDEIKLKKLTECRLLMENLKISDEEKTLMIKEILELDDKKEIKQPSNRVQMRSVKVEEIVQEGPRVRAIRRSTGLRRNN